MSNLAEIFSSIDVNHARLKEVESLSEPRRRYVIAMTPRSGSSYLCDVLSKVNRLGLPGEFLNQEFLPKIMTRIPGKTPVEYFRNVERVRKTKNGVFGYKASWYQFKNFTDLIHGEDCMSGYKYIYLTRRNLVAQAVSLYKATATSVFHTNIEHDSGAVKRLKELVYDYGEIDKWYRHIKNQEKGWRDYFVEHKINPCCVSYEEIDEDVCGVLVKIATYLGVNPRKIVLPNEPSVFSKVSDRRNMEWACRFQLERNALEYD